MSDTPGQPHGSATSIPTLTDVVVEGRTRGGDVPPLSVPLRAARTGAAPARTSSAFEANAAPVLADPDTSPDSGLVDAVAERLRTRLTRQLSDAVDAALMLHGPQIAATVQRQIEPWLRAEIAAEVQRAGIQAAPPPAKD